MHLTSSIWTALLLASSALAQTQNQSQCITTCVNNNLRSSWCDGGETGDALASCTCASYQGPSDPLIVCVKSCPAADVAQFAAKIPEKCRGTLFPGVTVASSTATTNQSAKGGITTATSTMTQATTTTPATAASSTHTGLAAVNQPAGMVMAMGVLAAFAI